MKKLIGLILILLLGVFVGNGWCPPPPVSSINVTEGDGIPSAWVYKLIFPNATITDNGNGTVTIVTEPGGVFTFLGAADTPVTYLGQAGKFVKVNAGENAVEFTDATVTGHTVLDSLIHTDTTTGTATRGDLIYVPSTGKWTRLPLGSSGSILTANATDTLWSTYSLSGTTGQTYTFPATTTTLGGLAVAGTWTAAQTFGDALLVATTPKITTGIKDANGLLVIGLTATGTAVDYLTVANAATAGHQIELGVAGTDVAITLNITGKGTGKANIDGNAATATALAADPANCAAGQIALGVNASGVAECTATPSGLTSVGATTFTGALTGNASTATTATNATNTAITDDTTTAATMYPTWVTSNTGNLPQKVSSTKLYFNPSTGMLTATGLSGPLTGNASSSSYSSASTITNATTAATMYPVWVTANTGNLGLNTTSSALSFRPDTGILTASGFAGPINGTVGATTPAAGTFTTLVAGSASSLTVGTGVGTGAAIGSVIFKNATNANTATIQSGTTSTSYALTLPTAVGGTNYLLNSGTAGAMGWTDPATFQAALTYPVTGVASPSAGFLTKWGVSGNAIVDGPKIGTFTDTKWCSYTTANGMECTQSAPTGAGTITKVGNIVTGEAFTTGVPGQTLTWTGAGAGTLTMQTVSAALGTVTLTLPAVTGTAVVASTSATATQAMFATSTAGAPGFRAIADTDLPSTIKGLTLTSLSVGFSIAGGTTPHTLTVTTDGTLGTAAYTAATAYAPAAGSSSIATVGTITSGIWSGTAVAADKGGTGQTSYTIGDLLYASSSSALSKLADAALGQVLVSGGAGAAPAYSANPNLTYISFGADPADTGTIRLSNNQFMWAENSTPGTDISVIGVTSGNIVQIGASGSSGVTITPTTTFSAGTSATTVAATATASFAAGTTGGAGAIGQYIMYNLTSGSVTLAPTTGALGSSVATFPVASGTVAFGTGTANQVAYWSATNTLTTETYLGVARGGSGIGAGTQYGLPYFSTTTLMASTAAGTSTTLLHGNAAGAPTWGAVSMTSDTTAGNWKTFYSNGTGVVTELSLGTTPGYVLTTNGAAAAPSWQVIPTGTIGGSSGSTDNAITTANGTGGSTIQGTLASIDDAGLGTFPGGLIAGKTTSTAGKILLYDDYSTEVIGAGWQGPHATSTMTNSYYLALPLAEPTAGQVLAAGTPASHISTMTWAFPALSSAGAQISFATAMTSGGIPYASASNTLSSSAALTQYGVLLGGGAGNSPTATTAGTTGQVFVGNTGTAPTWGTLAVSGLPIVTPLKGGTGIANADASTITISGAYPLTMTVGGATLLNFSSFTTGVSGYVKPSNVTYVPIGGDINTYITAASAGDTLILSAGTYTITSAINVSKQLNIVGQGNAGLVSVLEYDLHGTRIDIATAGIDAFNITSSNVRIAHLSLHFTSAATGTTRGFVTANNLDGLVITNVDVIHESSAGAKTAFDILGTDAILRDVTFRVTSTNSTAYGVYVHNDSSTSGAKSSDCHATNGTTVAGVTRSSPFWVYNNNDTDLITLNLFNSTGTSTNATASDWGAACTSTTSNAARLNVYNSTLNGGDYDLIKDGTNVATIYGGILINNTTSGTPTYGGTVAASAFTGTITNAANVAMLNESTDTTCFPAFLTDSTAGNFPLKTVSSLTFNSNTGLLSATGLAGAFNGTVGATTPAAGLFTTLGASGAVTMGSSTVDTGVFTMIKGAQTSDPQATFTLSADGVGGFTIATANGSDGDITLTPSGGDTIVTTNLIVGPAAPDDVRPTFSIRGDADSDAPGDTTEALTITLTPNATPTLATWGFTSTQSAGYTFDKAVSIGANNFSLSGYILMGADPSETGAIRLSAGDAIGWEGTTEVTLTNVAQTGLLLNSTMQMQFGDSGTHIAQLTDGHLDLTADTSLDLNVGAESLLLTAGSDVINVGTGTSVTKVDFGATIGIEAMSFTSKKVSGSAGTNLLYEANSTDINGVGWKGPDGTTGGARTTDTYLQFPNPDPAINQFMLFPAPTTGNSMAAWQTYGTFTGLAVILPSSDADPTSTAGALRHDSVVTNFTNGALRYYNGAAIKQVIDMTAATAEACTEAQAIVYDASADLWKCGSVAAGNAATITVVDSTDATSYIAMFDSATGDMAVKTDTGLTYAADTGILTATGLVGPHNGTVGATTPATGAFTTLTATGVVTHTPAARTSGTASYWTINTPADTGITAATEAIGMQMVTGTRTWATTGTVALQRERFFAGPTYASASASQTFTDVFNTYWTPPVQGTNAIFTRPHTLGIVDATSAASSITGGLIVATTLGTTATSVGIGGGNVNAGGNGTFGGTLSVTGHTTLEGVTSTGATGTGAIVYSGTPTLVTPVIGAATGTSLYATGVVDGLAPIVITATSAGYTISSTTSKSGYFVTNPVAAAATFNFILPTAAAGLQYCVQNGATKTGVLKITGSASGQFIDLDGTLSATGGFVSATAVAGNYACFIGIDPTHWKALPTKGVWTRD